MVRVNSWNDCTMICSLLAWTLSVVALASGVYTFVEGFVMHSSDCVLIRRNLNPQEKMVSMRRIKQKSGATLCKLWSGMGLEAIALVVCQWPVPGDQELCVFVEHLHWSRSNLLRCCGLLSWLTFQRIGLAYERLFYKAFFPRCSLIIAFPKPARSHDHEF